MIHVQDLKKAYGSVEALRGVSFDIAEGEIIGLLGPNGAGKTTIIKTLTGYLQPDSGVVKIDGLNVLTDTQAVQARIGYLPESAPLYPELTVQAYLQMMAGLRQIPPEEERARISEAVYATGLTDRLTQPIGQLSKGYRQRVGLAQAILHKPKLLILDEPTVGLDPTQIVEIRNLIKRLSRHSTVLFSTHILSEVEALCDRVIMLINGEIKLDKPLAEVATGSNALLTLDTHAEQSIEGADKVLQTLPGVYGIAVVPPVNGKITYRVYSDQERDLCPAIYQLAVEHNWPVRELRRDVESLESVFNKLAHAA